jgi:hypothetical protein
MHTSPQQLAACALQDYIRGRFGWIASGRRGGPFFSPTKSWP